MAVFRFLYFLVLLFIPQNKIGRRIIWQKFIDYFSLFLAAQINLFWKRGLQMLCSFIPEQLLLEWASSLSVHSQVNKMTSTIDHSLSFFCLLWSEIGLGVGQLQVKVSRQIKERRLFQTWRSFQWQKNKKEQMPENRCFKSRLLYAHFFFKIGAGTQQTSNTKKPTTLYYLTFSGIRMIPHVDSVLLIRILSTTILMPDKWKGNLQK